MEVLIAKTRYLGVSPASIRISLNIPLLLFFGIIINAFIIIPSFSHEINVILRMDDVGFDRHSTTQDKQISEVELIQRIVKIAEKHRAKISFAVIPNVISGSPMYTSAHPEYLRLSSSPGELTLLRDIARLPEIELTLHAWTHEPQIIHEGRGSEFGGLPYEEQYLRLSQGKIELEQSLSIPVSIFVPPFNNHDQNTLRALRELKFSTISSSARKDDNVEEILYIPSTTSLQELSLAIYEASLSGQENFIVALFHGYDFKESGFSSAWLSLDDFDTLLLEIISHHNIRFTTIGEAPDITPLTHPFNAELSRSYAHYRDRLSRIIDILNLLGSHDKRIMSLFGSGKVIYAQSYMQRITQKLLLTEILINAFAGIIGLFVYYLSWRIISLHSWANTFHLFTLSGAFIVIVFLFTEGIFGMIGHPGFGSRLVLALTVVNTFLFIGILQLITHRLKHRNI